MTKDFRSPTLDIEECKSILILLDLTIIAMTDIMNNTEDEEVKEMYAIRIAEYGQIIEKIRQTEIVNLNVPKVEQDITKDKALEICEQFVSDPRSIAPKYFTKLLTTYGFDIVSAINLTLKIQ